ncbi:MAG: hypothetical protein KZQ58_01910 [gamma proteobacterium symbiont of Bathyaustriella thionipta]|nr:hypothetical protein [gamma proteobacterium symbiont of Bathyaustriella thionipta]
MTQGSTLLGGMTQAFVVALLNILPAFVLCGMLILRYLQHVSWWRKLLAFVSLLVYLAWVGLFNLGVAHFRDLLGSDPQQAVELVLQQMQSQPFVLANIDSWLLFMMGILFTAIAAYDGFKSDDAYPGYGRRQRRMYDIQDHYDAECARLAEQVAAIRSEFLDELEQLAARIRQTYPHLCHLVEEKQALIARHQHCVEDLQTAADALIHRYRQQNRLHRKTPAPLYFEQPWLNSREFALLNPQNESGYVRRQKQFYESFSQLREKTANQIEQIYDEFFVQLQSLEPSLRPLPRTPGEV